MKPSRDIFFRLAGIFYLFSLCFFLGCGCAVIHSLRHPFSAVTEGSNGQNPTVAALHTGVNTPALSLKPTSPKSGIASFFTTLMRISIGLGLFSLAAGGALIYFGAVIPGVKCILAGIALPVAAIWLNFHYALVIWLILVSSAIGFLWALKKYDPQLASSLLNDAKFASRAAENELKTLKTKLNL